MNKLGQNTTISPHSFSNTTNITRQGWTNSPNGRGTIDIIWDCGLTTFLCCWSVLVINVPKPGTGTWHMLYRKTMLLIICAAAPEIIFQIALGQLLSAHQSVKDFHKSGHKNWTLRHAFYADMGGFHLQTENWPSFPIDTKQMHYLITRGYIDYPELQDIDIRDKDKVDGMLRLITLAQTLWFIVNMIFRAVQRLTITTLELSSAAFVIMSVATTICWLRKPADVQHPDIITMKVSLAEVLVDAGVEATTIPYTNTPLDFAGRENWAWSIIWTYGLRYLRKFNLASLPVERPVNRIQNTFVPPISGAVYCFFVFAYCVYFAVFIAAWNFTFPTPLERKLWRITSTMALCAPLLMSVVMHLTFYWLPTIKRRLKTAAANAEGTSIDVLDSKKSSRTAAGIVYRVLKKAQKILKRNPLLRDPAMDAPTSLILGTWFCGILYGFARIYILVADVIELRSLPASAYQSVDWEEYWPHF